MATTERERRTWTDRQTEKACERKAMAVESHRRVYTAMRGATGYIPDATPAEGVGARRWGRLPACAGRGCGARARGGCTIGMGLCWLLGLPFAAFDV